MIELLNSLTGAVAVGLSDDLFDTLCFGISKPWSTYMDVKGIQEQLRSFASERDWEQYHSPKNLSVALAVEAAELMEIFQWVTPEESRNISKNSPKHDELKAELADVLIYALRLADVASVDLESAIHEKIQANAEKYPPGQATNWSI
jgi:NTP pyrophosphatase (non-canonical NTP hydrolase)